MGEAPGSGIGAAGVRGLASAEAALAWFAERGVSDLSTDSRAVGPGDAFIAWPGHAIDARRFVPQALSAGASACLVEADGAAAFGFPADGSVASLAGLKAASGFVASGFMGRPSERLHVVASTGTNGKTSTAWWTAQALSALGRRCGVVGTLGIGAPPSAGQPAGEVRAVTGLTTPDPVTLHRAFQRFADEGFVACAIEASSIGLEEERLAGTRIAVAQFTNFTQDHLDYHGSMDAYWRAKARLFGWPGLRAAVVNVDDGRGAALGVAAGVERWTFAVEREARLRAAEVGYVDGGLCFTVHEGADRAAVATALIGDYNVSNLLAVIGALRALGVTLGDAAGACRTLTPVPGRMQRVEAVSPVAACHDGRPARVGPGARAGVDDDLPQVVVDYAHTPDALEKVLLALAPFARQRGGALWCVFGCGGNRDVAKRPLMGAVAARLAGRVVVTSDNPRLEAPEAILSHIVAGMKDVPGRRRAEVIENRAEAIGHAVRGAAARDVILVAGKGHEDYQDAGGIKQPFSDVATAVAALRRRGEGGAP